MKEQEQDPNPSKNAISLFQSSTPAIMLVIPLKVPKAFDLTLPLSKWVDSKYSYEEEKRGNENVGNNNSEPFASTASRDCRDSILRMKALRNSISSCIGLRNAYKVALKEDVLKDCMEYHARLLECEARGFPIKDTEGKQLGFKVEWECAFSENNKVRYSAYRILKY